VQADLLVHVALQLPAGELGDQYLVLEGTDLQRESIVLKADEFAGDFGDQGSVFL